MPHDDQATNVADDDLMVNSSPGGSRQQSVSRRTVTETKTGIGKYDLCNDDVSFTDAVYQILGLCQDVVDLDVELFQSCIHPDDLEQTRELLDDGQLHEPGQVEVRIVQPEDPSYVPSDPGNYRTIDSWSDGHPTTAVRTIELTTFQISQEGHDHESITITVSDVTPTGSVLQQFPDSDENAVPSTFAGTPSQDLFEELTSGSNIGFFRIDASTSTFLSVNEFMGTLLGVSHERLIGENTTQYISPDIDLEKIRERVNQCGHTSEELEITTADGRVEHIYMETNTHIVHGRPVVDGVVFCPRMTGSTILSADDEVPDNVSLLEYSFYEYLDSVSDDEADDGWTKTAISDANTRLHSLVQGGDYSGNVNSLVNWLDDAREHPTIIDVRLDCEADYELIIEIEAEVIPTKLISEITNFAPYPNRRVLTTMQDGVYIERIALSREFVKPSDLDV